MPLRYKSIHPPRIGQKGMATPHLVFSSNSDQPVSASCSPGSKEKPLYQDSGLLGTLAMAEFSGYLPPIHPSTLPFTNKTLILLDVIIYLTFKKKYFPKTPVQVRRLLTELWTMRDNRKLSAGASRTVP